MENSPVDTSTISGVNSGKALFQFKGHFHGRPVTWQCTLQTLDQYYQEMLRSGKITNQTPVSLRKFIEISDIDSATPVINIGLDVEKIDEPTIRKTIVMVHNYKKLHAGRHEYGEIYHYPKE